jgi:hypothetical protein
MASHRSFGTIPKDLAVSRLSTEHLSAKLAHTVQHVDLSVVSIEKDIYELQDIAYNGAEETLNSLQEIATVQNDMVDLQYAQSLPWFTKSNFTYGEVRETDWNNGSVPDADNQLFVRYVDLPETYTGMLLVLPRVNTVGEARHVSLTPKIWEAVVYISMNVEDAVRLSSFDVEWFPPVAIDDSDRFVGHAALLSKPDQLNGFLFGSSGESNGLGQCVVFPNSGPYYIQSIHLDNHSGHSRIMLVGQKYQESDGKKLGGFVYYGIQ